MENFSSEKHKAIHNVSSANCKGIHILSLCNLKNDKAKKLEEMIEEVRFKRQKLIELGLLTIEKMKELWDEYHFYLQQLHHDFLVKQIYVENITTTSGRAVLARRLAGNNTYSGNVSHTALGDNATAPNVADTQLGNEVYRKGLSSGNFANNISYLETFFTAAEVSGTFEEYGNFIDGSGVADSGQLFNRFTQTITKSSLETLNVQSTITINDA